MSIVLDGTTGITTPGLTNTGTETIVNLTTTGNTILGDASTDTLNVGNGGLVKDASGNVGIGVTPPVWYSTWVGAVQSNVGVYSGKLNAYLISGAYLDASANWIYTNTGVAPSYFQQAAGAFYWNTAASGTAGNTITFGNAKMTLDSSGNLLVGRTSVIYGKFEVLGNSDWTQYNVNSKTSNINGIRLYYSGAAPNNTLNYFLFLEDSSTARFYVMSNGGIANFSGNNVNLSDRREKTNFSPAGNYLTKICAIPVQTFNYIDQNLEEDDGLTLGVVAQDVQAVAPELVLESNWGSQDETKMRLSIYQTDLQYALMKCIQELKALVDTQASTITQLQADVAALKAQP